MADGAIWVTGLGLVSSLGFGVAENWRRLLAGESAIAPLSADHFALPIALPTRLAALVPRAALEQRIQAAVPRQVWNTSAEVCHAWLLAALEALEMAGMAPVPDVPPTAAPPERIGVYVGNGAGAGGFIEQEYVNVYTAAKAVRRDVSRMAVAKYMPSALAAQLSILAGFRGPSLVLNTACSSGAAALLTARDALRLGRIDVAVAGGADLPVTAAVLKGFANIGALTTRDDLGARACRPFEADRGGFVLGEAAACLVLERGATAQARGAKPLACLRGGALGSEAHHLLAPRADGAGMADCIALALADAALAPERVAHVYAHGTGTAYNDRCEALALGRVLPHGPTVSAAKAQLGHTLGAAGAVDAVLAVQSLATGRVVPLRHLERPDPECPIRPALRAEDARLGPEDAIAVNSFAFGGHNAVLLLTRPRPPTLPQGAP